MTNKQAVIYCRVSTDEQAKGYSLETQIAACGKYAKDHDLDIAGGRYFDKEAKTLVDEPNKNTVPFRCFADDYTGESLDRPDLDRLRAFIGRTAVDVMIVYDLDRLARKSVYQMLLEEELSGYGVVVEYVNGQYADSDEGRLQKQIKSSIAEYEKAKILERAKRGKRGKAQGGFVVLGGRTPYGYTLKAEPHKAWLIINEEEKKIVLLIFEWYLYGDGQTGPRSMQAVALELSRLDIPTRGDTDEQFAKTSGHGVWSSAMVRHILTNETYTGVWHYGKTKVVKENAKDRKQSDRSGQKRGQSKQVARARDEWIAVQVPPIISRALFEAADRRLKHNREQAKRNAKRDYLLGRRLKCLKCGRSMRGKTRRDNQYYLCKGYEERPVRACDQPLFRADEMEETVWRWLKDIMQHPDQLAEGLQAEKAEAEHANRAITDRLALVNAKIAENQGKLDKLLDLYLDGQFDKEVLTERKLRLTTALSDLHDEHADLSEHLHANIPTDEEIAAIVTHCREVGEGLDNATIEDKRRYIDWLNVRGKLIMEDGEKVIYVKCRIAQQRLPIAVTSL
jgi:site-specific DNA recombinase